MDFIGNCIPQMSNHNEMNLVLMYISPKLNPNKTKISTVHENQPLNLEDSITFCFVCLVTYNVPQNEGSTVCLSCIRC